MVIRIGLIGTGYAAKKRAEALQKSTKAILVAIAGQVCDRAYTIAQSYKADDVTVDIEADWRTLVQRCDIDLVIVATRNHLHGLIAHTALTAGKHVVVEYPLALDVMEAESLVALARSQQRLLHVEHIELLSGIHKTIKMALPQLGEPRYCHSISYKGERPAPQKWSYNAQEFGFPLTGALSRIQRLIDLFGAVTTVNCHTQYWSPTGEKLLPSPHLKTYASVLCTATLSFSNGVVAEVTYGKGECIWSRERSIDVHGTEGRLQVNPNQGIITRDTGSQFLTIGTRQGLFLKDTTMVLNALDQGQPLYVTPEESVYALKVAEAARLSAEEGRLVELG